MTSNNKNTPFHYSPPLPPPPITLNRNHNDKRDINNNDRTINQDEVETGSTLVALANYHHHSNRMDSKYMSIHSLLGNVRLVIMNAKDYFLIFLLLETERQNKSVEQQPIYNSHHQSYIAADSSYKSKLYLYNRPFLLV
jgi:glutaminase